MVGCNKVVVSLVSLFGAVAAFGATVYVAEDAEAQSPYDTAETGFNTIGEALEFLKDDIAAGGNPSLAVMPGEYVLTDTVSMDKPLTIYGVGSTPEREVLVYAPTNAVAFNVANAEARVHSLSLGVFSQSGFYVNDGVVSNCVVRDAWGVENKNSAPALDLYGGLVSHVVVSNISMPWAWGQLGIAARVSSDGKLYNSTFCDTERRIGAYVLEVNGGTVSNCVVRGIKPPYYGYNDFAQNAMLLKGGLVTHCVITNNGTYSGTISSGSTASGDRGAGTVMVSGGTLRNTLIADNYGRDAVGIFVSGGVVENCTVWGNHPDKSRTYSGRDLHQKGGIVRNCLIWGNGDEPDKGVYIASGCSTENCMLITGASAATGNILDIEPRLKDPEAGDFSPHPACKSVDAAQTLAWMTLATDLVGKDRIIGDAPDIGAYEAERPKDLFLCKIVADGETTGYVSGDATKEYTFTATYSGIAADVTPTHEWYVGDSTTPQYGASVTLNLGIGMHKIRLRSTIPGDYAEDVIKVTIYGDRVYLSEKGKNIYPYNTWETATTSFDEAIRTVNLDGDSRTKYIFITNGTYSVNNSVVISNPIKITAPYGQAVLETSKLTSGVFTLKHDDALIENICFTNGGYRQIRLEQGYAKNITMAGCRPNNDAGLLELYNDTQVDNLVITNAIGRWAYGCCAVRLQGTSRLNNFLIEDSYSCDSILIMYESSIVSNGVIRGMSVDVANGRELRQNAALIQGRALLTHCVITGIDGLDFSSLGVVTVAGNATMRNCLVYNNKIADIAGVCLMGDGGAVIENCTFVDNISGGAKEACTRSNKGTGNVKYSVNHAVDADSPEGDTQLSYGATFTGNTKANKVINCLFIGEGYLARKTEITTSRADVALAGEGNITDVPRFVKSSSRPYTPSGGSKIVNKGTNLDWMESTTDIYGNSRIYRKTCDIGAVESQLDPATVIILR